MRTIYVGTSESVLYTEVSFIRGSTVHAHVRHSYLATSVQVCLYYHQVTVEQIKLDLTDPSIMPSPDRYDKLVTIATDPYEAVHGAHAMVICTEWDEFTQLDYQRVYDVMEKPAFIFDGRLILDHQKLLEIGFQVEAVGKVVTATNPATPPEKN